jgi:hypothetical protein
MVSTSAGTVELMCLNREGLRTALSIAKLLKSTGFPCRFAVGPGDFPKLDVVGSNPIARYEL